MVGQDTMTRVCVVSSQPIVVAGIRALLDDSSRADRDYLTVTDPDQADVVIYDVFRIAAHPVDGGGDGGGDGGTARELTDLVARHPGRVLALSRLLQPGLTARALANGAVAPVSVSADADEVAALVDAAVSGTLAADPEQVRRYEADLVRALAADVELTPRQQTVLARIAAGYSNDEIAADLYITVNTVKSSIRAIYARIGVATRTAAVAWALDHGYGGMTTAPGRSRRRRHPGRD